MSAWCEAEEERCPVDDAAFLDLKAAWPLDGEEWMRAELGAFVESGSVYVFVADPLPGDASKWGAYVRGLVFTFFEHADSPAALRQAVIKRLDLDTLRQVVAKSSDFDKQIADLRKVVGVVPNGEVLL